jgi:hypothetical protein
MTPFDRLTWVASFLAPLVGWLIVVLFGAFVSQEALPARLVSPRTAAWLSALLVLIWLASHLTVRFHGRRARDFSRDDKAELAFRLNSGHGYAHWRALMRGAGKTWYRGRSHGEHPRYD